MHEDTDWGGGLLVDPPLAPHYRDEVEGPSHVQDEASAFRTGRRITKAFLRRGDVIRSGCPSDSDRRHWTSRRSCRRGGQTAVLVISSARETALTLRLLCRPPAAPSRRVPARPVRDDAPRPLRPRLYDALPALSASEAPSATGPAGEGILISCLTAQVCPSSGTGEWARRETRWPRQAWLAEAPPWRRSVRRDPCPHADRGDW